MKFHVGDRWADQWDVEHLIVAVGYTHGQAFPLDGSGELHYFSLGTGEFERSPEKARLTRLISSERWIPFAEMMPEAPMEGDKRRLLLGFTTGQILLCKELGGSWSHVESGARVGLDTARNMCAFLRYLTPPEAS